jgi:2-aminoadipate transaminase
MRLNFSGVDEDAIREGIRRIGEVVREQVAMYGTLTGGQPARPAQSASDASRQEGAGSEDDGAGAAGAPAELAKILHMPVTHKRAG